MLPEDETAYLEKPNGFEEPGKEDWVMELRKRRRHSKAKSACHAMARWTVTCSL